jgi:hypothetical protein
MFYGVNRLYLIKQILLLKNYAMDSQKVDMYIMANSKFFEPTQLPFIRERLMALPDEKWILIQSLQLKDPTTLLIVSILAGTLGIDRFMLGDTGMGIGKLLTLGGCGIWALVDLFLIMGAARQKNMTMLQPFLY